MKLFFEKKPKNGIEHLDGGSDREKEPLGMGIQQTR